MGAGPAAIEVVAGALYDGRGRVLITQRPAGKALAGRWEFPGGKLHAGEDARDGLVRELREELGVEVHAAERLMRYTVEYPERTVWLDMWIVTSWSGTVVGLEGQAWAWVEPAALSRHDILEADQPIVAALAVRTAPAVTGTQK
ncbi:MAG: 8-oxo-dGTP diphosphatase MutT [Steroidobacteraceae bacterium]